MVARDRLAVLARSEQRRRRHRARGRSDYHSSEEAAAEAKEKVHFHRVARKRLLELEPTKTCIGISELEGHSCSGKIECHHRDGDWRNNADSNLGWACRAAHEILDRLAGV